MSAFSKLGRGFGIRRRARRAAVTVLPAPLVYELWHRRAQRCRRTDLSTASEVRRVDIDDDSHIAVYWSDVPRVGTGPSASVYVLDEEVLRIDCFGGGRGHMHLNPSQTNLFAATARLYFGIGSIADELERAHFEVVHNTPAAVESNGLRRVRGYVLDQDRLRSAADEMHGEMTNLLRARSQTSTDPPIEKP